MQRECSQHLPGLITRARTKQEKANAEALEKLEKPRTPMYVCVCVYTSIYSHPGVDRIPVIFQTRRYNMVDEAVSEWTEG